MHGTLSYLAKKKTNLKFMKKRKKKEGRENLEREREKILGKKMFLFCL